jgi:hypothetical protein
MRQVIAFLNGHFQDCWIDQVGPVAWSVRLPDLSPLDYLLWDHMKSLVYVVKPNSRAEFLDPIMSAHIKNDHDHEEGCHFNYMKGSAVHCQSVM